MNLVWILLSLSPIFAYGQDPEPTSRIGWDPVCGKPRPDPWSVSKIAPDVVVFSSGKLETFFIINDMAQIGPKIDELTTNGHFKIGRQVVFIVHGFLNNFLLPWQYTLKDAILNAEDSTVFIVSWGGGAFIPSYPQAGANTETVAKVVSALGEAIFKSKTFNSDPNKIYLYCIGHSLGAQVCGQAGRLSGHFNRVTGMDPAGPGFETCWSQYKVGNDSAACVDHIHTDGSGKGHVELVVPHYGSLNQWGHVDFYPNGGDFQTGCFVGSNDFACSHMRAIDLFTYTVANPSKCIANQKCSNSQNLPQSCSSAAGQQMGYYSTCNKVYQKVKTGMYYLSTTDKSPFC